MFLQDCLFLSENSCHQNWDFLRNLSIFDNILLGKFPQYQEIRAKYGYKDKRGHQGNQERLQGHGMTA